MSRRAFGHSVAVTTWVVGKSNGTSVHLGSTDWGGISMPSRLQEATALENTRTEAATAHDNHFDLREPIREA